MPSPAVLVLVRHGETSANIDAVWHGSTDTPLTELGRRQAHRVGKLVAVRYGGASALYSSDLTRARDTAGAIASELSLEVRLDPMLREFDLGEWEGRSFRELHEQHDLWGRMKSDPHYAPHGGESPQQVTTRIVDALERIARAHPGETVVVVAHGGAFSMALGALIDGDYSSWRRVVSNCGVCELVLEPAPALLRFDDTEHLDGL